MQAVLLDGPRILRRRGSCLGGSRRTSGENLDERFDRNERIAHPTTVRSRFINRLHGANGWYKPTRTSEPSYLNQ